MLYEHFEFFDVRLKVPKNKFFSITFLRPALIFLNSENNLKEKIFHQPWGVWSSRANLAFSKSVVLTILLHRKLGIIEIRVIIF